MRGIDGGAVDLGALHQTLCTAVRDAGAEVLRLYRRGNVTTWRKDDRSPVSEADLAADAILKTRLLSGAASGFGWLSEEDTGGADQWDANRPTFIVDPLDGTRAFLEGVPEFTICAALVAEGRPVLSAVFNPVTDEFFDAAAGRGAFRNGQTLAAGRREALAGGRLLAPRAWFDNPRAGYPGSDLPAMDRAFRSSTAYRLCLVAAGEFDAAIALGPKCDWDLAPGALIAEEAGAVAGDHHGEPFVFARTPARQRSLVCANPVLYREIITHLSPGAARSRAASPAASQP